MGFNRDKHTVLWKFSETVKKRGQKELVQANRQLMLLSQKLAQEHKHSLSQYLQVSGQFWIRSDVNAKLNKDHLYRYVVESVSEKFPRIKTLNKHTIWGL